QQVLFTYLHLAGVDPRLTSRLLERHVTAVAYETVQLADGSLPLLAPMSAIAGRLAVQVGAHYSRKPAADGASSTVSLTRVWVKPTRQRAVRAYASEGHPVSKHSGCAATVSCRPAPRACATRRPGS